jgi:transcriptional regulator with XRE-family HTH domain
VSLHAKIKEARQQCQMSQAHVAEALEITPASYSRLEAGLSAITTERLNEMAQIFDVSAGALLEGSIVRLPHRLDMDRLRMVVTEIENTIASLDARPSPEKVADAVAEVYQTEIEYVFNHPKQEFDPSRHRRLIELIFRK